MKIAEIAHSRAGDKGPFVTLSLTPYVLADYPSLRATITENYVATHMRWAFPGGVRRFEVDNLASLHFIGTRDAADSVTLSLAMDRHGKSFSSLLLDLQYPA